MTAASRKLSNNLFLTISGSGVARPAGTSKPALDNWIPFEVNMSDFPQLSDVPVPCASTTPILDQKEYSGKVSLSPYITLDSYVFKN